MKSETPYTAKRIREFSSVSLLPRLGVDFRLFKRRDPMRVLANFVQLLTLTGGRYGESLRIYPTIYIVGAYPWDEVITQSVVATKDGRAWVFQNRDLDNILADEILLSCSSIAPSYEKALSARIVLEALSRIARGAVDERGAIYLAFFLMANDLGNAAPWLEFAQEMFMRNNKRIEHEWQHRTETRIGELRLRLELSAVDRAEACRKEADQHATLLGLPAIRWLA